MVWYESSSDRLFHVGYSPNFFALAFSSTSLCPAYKLLRLVNKLEPHVILLEFGVIDNCLEPPQGIRMGTTKGLVENQCKAQLVHYGQVEVSQRDALSNQIGVLFKVPFNG